MQALGAAVAAYDNVDWDMVANYPRANQKKVYDVDDAGPLGQSPDSQTSTAASAKRNRNMQNKFPCKVSNVLDFGMSVQQHVENMLRGGIKAFLYEEGRLGPHLDPLRLTFVINEISTISRAFDAEFPNQQDERFGHKGWKLIV